MNFDNQNVHGPDVSFYQDNDATPQQIDFETMKAAGASFVIVRAGQRNYTDPDFAHNWQAAKQAGLPRGTYWLFDSRADPKEQARLWWELIKDDIGELPHFLDLEEKYGGSWSGWQHWYDMLYEFQRISKLPVERIGIYTGFYYWIERAPMHELNLIWFER
jgi:GH25 family lysozyme M1 (1,4-beta-N-acetylmuramidase)